MTHQTAKLTTKPKTKKTIKLLRFEQRQTKIISFKDLQKLSKKLKASGKKIVFTIGSFHLLNPGQCKYLIEGKERGDILVVGVSTDASEQSMRGEEFPALNQEIRAELVSYLKYVDYVTIVDRGRHHASLILLKPDVFYTHQRDWDEGIMSKQDTYLTKSYGGIILKKGYDNVPYFGTERLIEHVADIRVVQLLENFLKDKIEGFSLDPKKHLQPADFGIRHRIFQRILDNDNFMIQFSDLEKIGEKFRKQGKRVVFVSGSYDLLHVGHARFIEQAGLLGDVLIVGIPSDIKIRDVKGLGRPVISEQSRAFVLGFLDPVDYVLIYDDWNVRSTLRALKPDVFFTVEESWNKGYKTSEEYKIVKSYGGEIASEPRQAPFLSASAMIDRAALRKVKEIFRECMDEQRYKQILSERPRLTEHH